MPAALVATLSLGAFAGEQPATQGGGRAPNLSLDVNRAIESGVACVRRAQLTDGAWPGEEAAHPGGMTALATYTLIKSGVSREDESVRRGLSVVLRTDFRSTYSQAVRLMLLESLRAPSQWKSAAQSSLDFLVKNQDAASGGWAYPTGGVDLSNTQFALLGLRAAHHLGLAIPDAVLLKCANGMLRGRDGDGNNWFAARGGFRYWMNREPSGGMTAAALAGLAVIRELGGKSSELQALFEKNSKSIESSEQWLAHRFDVAKNPLGESAWTPSFHFPYLWALERYGGLCAKPKIGEHAWYDEGARWLVERQGEDGHWGGSLQDTCFALLFLRRATVTQGDEPAARANDGDATERTIVPEPKHPLAGAPYLTDWLLAGPYPCKGEHEEIATPPFDVAKLDPKEKQKLLTRTFERVALLEHGWSDLEKITQRGGDSLLWVVATKVKNASSAPIAARLWFTFEDGWSIWFDGKRLDLERREMAPIEENVSLAISIAPGEHSLVVLVEDAYGVSAFGARACDEQGNALDAHITFGVGAVRAHGK